MSLQLRIYVPEHPLIQHWLAVARDASTPSVLFKTAMTELGRWLTYEATRTWLPTREVSIQTPLAEWSRHFRRSRCADCRNSHFARGIGIVRWRTRTAPLSQNLSFGAARDEETLRAHCYLNKLPQTFKKNTQILILEPMLATGGSISLAMKEIIQRGGDPALIRIISVVAAPPALQQLSQDYPSLNIFAAIIDEGLNSQGYILPGLGDAGDRAFGT